MVSYIAVYTTERPNKRRWSRLAADSTVQTAAYRGSVGSYGHSIAQTAA